MIRWAKTLLLPGIAVASLVFAVSNVLPRTQSKEPPKPPIEPAHTPFTETVAGSGIVEPSSENISLGAHLPGIVAEVLVRAGDRVQSGQPLFRVDDRQLKADLKARDAALEAARAEVKRLEQMPRPEEIPVSEAKVAEAKARLAEKEDLLARGRKLMAARAIGKEEWIHHEQEFSAAAHQLAQARAADELLKAGAWGPDLDIARAAVAQAEAEVEKIKVELERLTVAAPVDGDVLQVNVRPGEFVGAPPAQALVVLGAPGTKHVRVDIDEHDIPRFHPDLPARATLRGDQNQSYQLSFVRLEPYVVPKKSLTGDNTERVDTRVLQVIYAIEPGGSDLHVGQQVDVFLDRASLARRDRLSEPALSQLEPNQAAASPAPEPVAVPAQPR